MAHRRTLLGWGAALLASGCAAPPQDGDAALAVDRDIPYGRHDLARLDVYRPEATPAQPLPILVYFHGGGWHLGRKDELQEEMFARRLARRGVVVVSANYRLSPEAQFPNFLEDGAHATAWITEHAETYGGDPRQVFLAGHSAGAYNAVLLALDSRYLDAAGADYRNLRGAISLAGFFGEWFMGHPLYRAIFPRGEARDRALAERFLRPAMPPLLLLAGTLDTAVPPSESRGLAAKGQQLGAPVEARLYAGIGHLGIMAAGPWLPSLAPVVEDITGFMRRSVVG